MVSDVMRYRGLLKGATAAVVFMLAACGKEPAPTAAKPDLPEASQKPFNPPPTNPPDTHPAGVGLEQGTRATPPSTPAETKPANEKAQPYLEEFSKYYQGLREGATTTRIDRREIMVWATSPKEKKRIGFLETREIQSKGSSDSCRFYFIRDAKSVQDLGLLTNDGVLYRLGPTGELNYLGKFNIITTGLKQLFGISAQEHLDLEEIDPYK